MFTPSHQLIKRHNIPEASVKTPIEAAGFERSTMCQSSGAHGVPAMEEGSAHSYALMASTGSVGEQPKFADLSSCVPWTGSVFFCRLSFLHRPSEC